MADQLNVTTGTAGSIASTAAELINDLKAQLLRVVEFSTELEQIFEKEPINQAKVVQWNRMERLTVGTTPSQLTEGVNPDAVGLQINQITATVEEYGNVVAISRLAQMTARHNVVQNAVRTLGLNMAEVRDRLLYNVADAATNAYRINDRANDNAIQIGDTLSYEELVEARATLAKAGVPKWPNGMYRAITPSMVYATLQVDPNWLAARQFQKPDDINRGYVGSLAGVDVIETTSNSFSSTASGTTGNSSKIYSFFICGPGFAKVTDLETGQMNVQPPGSGDDVLKRRWKMGWFMTFKSVITDQSFGRRGRASGKDAVAA